MATRCSSRASSSLLSFTARALRQTRPRSASFLTPALPHSHASTSYHDPTPTFPPTQALSHLSLHRTASSSRSLRENDTIFALATGAGRAGVAIIRISGPAASQIYFRLCRTASLRPYRRLPPTHKLVLRNLHHPTTGELLDAGAGVIYFPAGASYTGEESLELHIHGGPATIADTLEALARIDSTKRERGCRVRMAEPGEFTRRAFEHGRLDLSSAEALHSLISAETSVQRQIALQGARGLQAQRYEAMRSELLRAMALVEALIDFSDEDGVEDGTWNEALRCTHKLAALLRNELGLAPTATDADGGSGAGGGKDGGKGGRHVGEILTNGVRLAIYGPPNAGKSSLLNRLADRNAAIVSSIPGTTRDVLQVHLDLGGYKVIVYDTAGLRDQASPDPSNEEEIDEVEQIGMERARQVVSAADLSLLVLPSNAPAEAAEHGRLRPDSYTPSDPDLVLFNKLDLHPPPATSTTSGKVRVFHGSALTGAGIAELTAALAELIGNKYAVDQHEPALITQARHRAHLHACLDHLVAFEQCAHDAEPDYVLAAEELRYAAKAIGRITGRDLAPDEVLGSIFSTFCIGK